MSLFCSCFFKHNLSKNSFFFSDKITALNIDRVLRTSDVKMLPQDKKDFKQSQIPVRKSARQRENKKVNI